MSRIERLFVGRRQPTLIAAAQTLMQRYARLGVWDLTPALLVVPGRQAGRRLRQIIEGAADTAGIAPTGLTDPVTPADLLERLYRPELTLATPWQARFAWMQAARRLYEGETTRPHMAALAPRLSAPQDVTAWGGVAAEAQRLRETTTAESLSLADIAAAHGDRRWAALACLETAYRAVLAESGLADKDDARLAALQSGEVACRQDVVLVGVQDINGLERAMLNALTSSVCAIIPALEDEQDGFDEIGGLRGDFWQDIPLPLPDERLHFVEGPAEEVGALISQIAGLNTSYSVEEITIGVGDVSEADTLARRLAVSGLPTTSPFGRPLGRLGPGALLQLVHDYLQDNGSARRLAALVRHPDLELWLATNAPSGSRAGWPETAQAMAAMSLIHCLDHYLAECLVEPLPATEATTPTTPLDAARLRVLTARDRLHALLAPLRGTRPLPQWAGPITDLLKTVCREPSEDDTVEDRQSRRSLAGVRELLHELRRLPTALAPIMTGREALAFICAEAETIRLPSESNGPAMSMRGWLELAWDDAPVLLLTGLHEGSVPAGTGDDGLLPDSLRRRCGLADDRRRQARDTWLLRVMLESRKHVQIIVTRRGADGTPKMPSRLLFACDGPTAAKRAQAFTSPPQDSVPKRPLFAPGRARRLPPPRPEPPVTEINSLKVTAFRDYLACPYRFYLRHVAGLDEMGDDADEMDPRAFGNLLHPCLEAFARSAAADSTDPSRITAFLRDELERQGRRRFGGQSPAAVKFQIRQAGRRLDAFAHWQAQSARDGWQIQNDLAEREMEAALDVDGRPFVIRGRLDRVDYHPATDRFRLMDYKTGDSGASPEDKHRTAAEGGGRTWTDLQLPLYRTLLAAQGFAEASIEVGYVLLAADLNPTTVSPQGKTSGGTGYVGVRWGEADYQAAQACAAGVVRRLRAGVFWPPADPPRFTDALSGLCLDACTDRAEWFNIEGNDGS